MKKSTRNGKKKVSEARLLKLWGDIVKEKAGWKCEYPDCTVKSTQLHRHHFYSRKHKAIKYDPDNGLCLCAQHHVLGSFSAHQDPDFKDKIIVAKVRSAEWREKLIEKRNIIITDNEENKRVWLLRLTTLWGMEETLKECGL
jgi:hypothetical protein